MTQDSLLILRTVFTSCWTLFAGWYVPGTNVTPAGIAMFALTVVVALRFFRRLGKMDDKD